MKFLVVSHRGAIPVPAHKQEESRHEWGAWMELLNEQAGLRATSGRTISSSGTRDYDGDSAGVSLIEAPSLDEALARVRACPGLAYGWVFDILYE